MQFAMISAVARAEMRSTRRLFRYWLFVGLSMLTATAMFGQYTYMHGMFSNGSATIGALGPRYLITIIGINMIFTFLVGLIFLAFDIRARDERDRMTEVLDSRPVSNLEFVTGKVLGLVLMVMMPLIAVSALLQAFGAVAVNLDLPLGETMEPVSLIGFLFSALTSIFLWCSVIVLVAIVIRHRLLVVVLMVGLLGLQIWIMLNLPLYQVDWFSVLPTMDNASDIIPRLVAEDTGLRIAAHWIMAGGLLCLAIALHPRRDGNANTATLGTGIGLLGLAVAALAGHAWQGDSFVEQQTVWRSAHAAKQDQPRPDMQSLTGTLAILPGDNVSMDLELRIQAQEDQALREFLFTLNPGISVAQVTVAGRDVQWHHENGLLNIVPETELAPGMAATVGLRASGPPDEWFGYLDSAFNLLDGGITTSQLAMLGFKTAVFAPTYVAMTPGGHWLPSSGTDTPQGDPRTHPHDYYTIDLEVEIPLGWLVAGPGRRTQVGSDEETVRYRFSPGAPVPHVGLIASRFEKRSMEVAGVELEVLFYPEHDRNLRFFADTEDEIREHVAGLLSAAENLGLPYPYNGMSLVETPNNLRGYGGGWRMDTVQPMPGVMMLRESSFPTSRFEMPFRNFGAKGEDANLSEAKLKSIEQYFENDFSGGNLFIGGSRNFLQFQTSARGEGALAVNFVLDELASKLLTGKRGYFSAHEFTQSLNVTTGETVQNIAQGRAGDVADAIHRAATDRPAVWDRALGASLAELEPNDDPRRSLNVLSLKGEAIARAIIDGLGRERTGALLSALVREFRGRHFEVSDLYRIASDLNIELEPLVGDWLHDASLPGFLVSSVETVRLTDDGLGAPRYQTRFHVRNGEPTPGLARMNYQWGSRKKIIWDSTGPIRIAGNSAVEVGIVTATPIYQLLLSPYLSLNRQDVKLSVPRTDSEERVNAEALIGSRVSDWAPLETEDIIIDDLDLGFSVRSDSEAEEVRMTDGVFNSFIAAAADMDQGLPEFRPMFGSTKVWSRATYADSWGKYRHTNAIVSSGAGDQHATFTANLPHAGRWRLSYYLGLRTDKWAKRSRQGVLTAGMLGEYQMDVVSDGDTREIEFDGKAAASGWNDLGEFQLPAGEVSLEISNANTGWVVIADAIRWRPATQDKQESTP